MLFAARFTNAADAAERRERLLPEHLAFLEAHLADRGPAEARVLAAGALREAADGPSDGGLWLLEAPDAAAVERLARQDPFWTGGVRAGVEVRHWTSVHAAPALLDALA